MVRTADHGDDFQAILSAFDWRCAYCGERPARLIREHMIPTVRGGDDSIENIVPACVRCNVRKSYRTPLEWFLVRDYIEAQRGKRPPAPYNSATPCWRCGGTRARLVIDTYSPLLPTYEQCTHCNARNPSVSPCCAGGRQ
jgi:hypothetical protein